MGRVSGLLLAAGAGRRYGMPKALVVEDGVAWLASGVRMLLEAGCAEVVVVLGASADEAAVLVPADPRVRTVIASRWSEGVSESLRAGLAALDPVDPGLVTSSFAAVGDEHEADQGVLGTNPAVFGAPHLAAAEPALPDAALVSLVDLAGLPAAAGARVIAAAEAAGPLAAALARATYRGLPGHPVLIGRDHWRAVTATLRGDHGAGPFLAARGALAVECGDLADGADRDRPGGP